MNKSHDSVKMINHRNLKCQQRPEVLVGFMAEIMRVTLMSK